LSLTRARLLTIQITFFNKSPGKAEEAFKNFAISSLIPRSNNLYLTSSLSPVMFASAHKVYAKINSMLKK